jgi:hypothetical protein
MAPVWRSLCAVALCALVLVVRESTAAQGGSVRMAQDAVRQPNTAASNDDKGQLVSCLSLKNETFKFEWKPRILMTDKTVVFQMDIIATNQFQHGNVCIWIWLDGVPDPIYEDCKDQECDQFVKFVQKYLPDIKCPIPKGYALKHVYPVKLVPTIPLPAGKYKVKVQVWNEAKTQILCFEGDVEIEDE